jgi:hypothetical protein
MNESVEFIQSYCSFDNPNHVWLLTGMVRNKDNQEPKSLHNVPEKYMRRLVITKPEDINTCYNEHHKMANKLGTVYRMYLSLNARDVVSTMFYFQEKLAKIGYGLARQQPDALALSKKIGSLWKTELDQERNRGIKRILFDIDEDDQRIVTDVLVEVRLREAKVYAVRKTVSGWAIVCDAHDTRWFNKMFDNSGKAIEIKRDALIFIEQWEGKDGN